MKTLMWLAVFGLCAAPFLFAEEMKTYYENGQLTSETPQQNGIPQGMARTYYENGQLMSETEYKEGELVGMTKMYYENGHLMREQDNATGAWKQYDESGKVLAEEKM